MHLGARTVDDDLLLLSVEQYHERWGAWGLSVPDVPEGDYDQLVRLRPIAVGRTDAGPRLPWLLRTAPTVTHST